MFEDSLLLIAYSLLLNINIHFNCDEVLSFYFLQNIILEIGEQQN